MFASATIDAAAPRELLAHRVDAAFTGAIALAALAVAVTALAAC